ncbi:MAG: tRNA 2-thiocytidine(32) synthetase TtcA [Myxococcales bacterium]|jgi:tRNA 2-thiocytidine biosynthesis protein TtcA|nr:tRNA 2-thiocytidine(32) synthetase TtcA [Myxococcales bacterium]
MTAPFATAKDIDALRQRLGAALSRTSRQYGLLAPGDRILVAVSGGKDSYALLHLLQRVSRKLPFAISLHAIHVHAGHPEHDPTPLLDWLANTGVPFDIARANFYADVQQHTQAGESPCALCSRMRRGVLYTWAQKRGCNKIALGHHLEDTLATFMMNLCYTGRLQAMPPRYTTADGRFEVIRPLVEISQADIAALAQALRFPIVACRTCPPMPHHRRTYMEEWLETLSAQHPRLKTVMLGALKNVRPTHLFDPTVQRVPREPNDEP